MAASDATSATERGQARERAAEYLLKRHRFRPAEALPWLIAIGVFFVFPDRMTFGSQVLVMVMFALSLDLILGYAGIRDTWSCRLLRHGCLYRRPRSRAPAMDRAN